MNWGGVGKRLGIDLRLLSRDGAIVLAGEYFPESGYVIDPATLAARFADVGEIALRNCFFLGELAMREFRVHIPVEQASGVASHPVIPSGWHSSVIGLFADETQAKRAKQRLLDGSLGSGLALQEGPLGIELRVERPLLGGRVASVIAGHGGAVISVDGVPLTPVEAGGPDATGPSIVGEQADASRRGIGVASDSQRPAAELGGSEEARGQ
jgi:hypothetical protein